MSTTVFITRCLKSPPEVRAQTVARGAASLLARQWRALGRNTVRAVGVVFGLAVMLCLAWVQPAQAIGLAQAAPALAAPAQLSQLRTERSEDGLFVTATVSFELPAVVEDALLKGIPLFFLIEAEVYRDRWYWTDARVSRATRTVRLAFQPLTRRWRVNIGAGPGAGNTGLRATFNQNYDTLDEALSAVQRVARWKVAEAGDLKGGGDHRLTFNFSLDLSQLPRPFQIGMVGQRDWTIVIEAEQQVGREPRSVVELARDPAPDPAR